VVLADRLVTDHDVVIEGGRIVAVEPSSEALPAGCRLVDATGCYVAPGFVDIHSDYIENVASPRPSVVMDLRAALYGVDRSLVIHGVTTIYHSLSIYGYTPFEHKPIRQFQNVAKMIELIDGMRLSETLDHLIRHRLHLRLELDAVDRYHEVEQMLLDGRLDMLSFMDHTPGQGQYRDLAVYSDTLKGYQEQLSDADVDKIIAQQQAQPKLSLAQISRLAELAREQGVAVASHDDDTQETLEFIWKMGATISEFPISLDVAHNAIELGMHTVAGAPNVVLGYSHSGNLSARESICQGATSILCSDYYPEALLRAVFVLHRTCGIDLAEAFALVTINPARAVGIDDEYGEIAVGKRADILLIRELHAGVVAQNGERAHADEPHPAGESHPAGTQHPAGESHPAGTQHPAGEPEEIIALVEEVFVEGRSVLKTYYSKVQRADVIMADTDIPERTNDAANDCAARLRDRAQEAAELTVGALP